jgi:putative oxygen-independent coproporphyrinogen III oxidase
MREVGGATASALGVLGDTTPRSAEIGVYVHAPFCEKRCHYCAFNTAPHDADAMRRYLAALAREIDLASGAEWVGRVSVASIFFGGGTPSLLSADELERLLERLRHRFSLSVDAEITVECNPESVRREKLEGYRRAGINRLSLGVQSLDDQILARLGRLHAARGARDAFDAARDAGFTNVSVDLMYGVPGLDVEGWERTVRGVFDWQPEHLSAYGLSLDPGSLWGAAGVDGLPAEDTTVAQYWALARDAAARGFEHYEISNYARPGFRSRHNLTYWRRGEYLAFGPGAAGFIGHVRYTNVKPVPRYCGALESGALPIDTSERLTERQALAERLILGLRTSDGVPAGWLEDRVESDPRLADRVAGWRASGFLTGDDGQVRLTERGFLLSDALFVDLL